MNTRNLITKCINGDGSCWNEFVRRYRSLVKKSIIYKMNRLSIKMPRTDLEDIVQEVFFSIWSKNKLSSLRSIDSIDAWLTMISINATTNYYRKRSLAEINTLSLDKSLTENPSFKLQDIIPCPKLDIGNIIKNKELQERIELELKKLNHKQRLALKLNLYEGKRHQDISKIMNIPINTVSTLIRRAKNTIKENLKKIEKN